jgi:hypothetical protein
VHDSSSRTLPSKHEALSSNPNTTKKEREGGRETQTTQEQNNNNIKPILNGQMTKRGYTNSQQIYEKTFNITNR